MDDDDNDNADDDDVKQHLSCLHVLAIPRAHADAYADHSAERDLHGPQRLVGWQDVNNAGEADDVGHGEQPLGHVDGVPLPPVAAICSGTVGSNGHIIDDFRHTVENRHSTDRQTRLAKKAYMRERGVR